MWPALGTGEYREDERVGGSVSTGGGLLGTLQVPKVTRVSVILKGRTENLALVQLARVPTAIDYPLAVGGVVG